MALNDGRRTALSGWIFRHVGRNLQGLERENFVARTVFRSLCILDILIGYAWLVQHPNRTTSKIYDPIRTLLDFLPGDAVRWAGGILLVLGAGALICSYLRSEDRTMLFNTGLAMYWTYWVVSDVYAMMLPRGSFTAAPVAMFAVIGHARAAASAHRITPRAYTSEQG